MVFVEICNVYVGKMIIKAAKRIFNSDKICRSYSDLNFCVTFLEHRIVLGNNMSACGNIRRDYRHLVPKADPCPFFYYLSCATLWAILATDDVLSLFLTVFHTFYFTQSYI